MAGLEASHQCLFPQRTKHSHRQVQLQGKNLEIPTRLIRQQLQLQRGLQYVATSMCMALLFFFFFQISFALIFVRSFINTQS